MANKNRKPRPYPYPIRVIRAHWRLFLSIVIGVIAFSLAPSEWRPVTRMLVGWDIGVITYVTMCIWIFLKCDTDQIRQQSVLQDEGRFAIPLLTVGAAIASIAAIFIELRTTAGSPTRDPLLLSLGVVTILLSWTFIHTIFTLHYAHEYYALHRVKTPGLRFPGGQKPGYWDFVYFSFVIGMTAQVSDVLVTSTAMRKIVSAHGMVAFIFNVALLALTVNIAASAM
jgi:uncharacterized membrane protein